MSAPQKSIITGHKIQAAVLDLIGEAQDYLVLTTAYLKSWIHLDHELKQALGRGVRVHCLIRTPDGQRRDREKAEEEIEQMQDLGVQVHQLERLHAKAYISETRAIVTSFNLVSDSQNSLELGVLLSEPTLVEQCFEALADYCPPIRELKTPRAPRSTGSRFPTPRAQRVIESETAFCIGCASPSHPYNLDKPLCRSCYRKSSEGNDYTVLEDRVCHRCGQANRSTVKRPLCYPCFTQLPEAERLARGGAS
jgi:hypothetical protein